MRPKRPSCDLIGQLSKFGNRNYLGDVRHPAESDRAVTYAQGELGPHTGPLTIGAFNPATRIGKGDRVFRGMIDDIRVFGSSADGNGALGLQQIRSIQQGEGPHDD